MAVLTIRNVPDAVYERLRARAAEQRRSINSEAIECLRLALAKRSQRNVGAFLDRARVVREGLATGGLYLTTAELTEAKREGRR